MNLTQSIGSFRRSRLAAHGFVIFGVWPLATIVAATIEAGGIPYYGIPLHEALAISALSVLLLAPDFAVTGLLALALSLWIFRPGPTGAVRRPSFRRFVSEPLVMLVAIFCGTCIWYPTVLSHALLIALWPLPTWLLFTIFVFIAASLIFDVAPRGKRARIAMILAVVGMAAPIPSLVAAKIAIGGDRPADIVVFGVDSLSQTDDVTPLRHWVASRSGTWYQHAVTPGLVTNAVWTSILTMQPLRDHGVFNAFQRLGPGQASLITIARRNGYHTISVFPDQLTCAIGSQAGFDEDRSGPVGWRQLALATIQNSSLLLPLVRPLLPRMPWSVAPPNHAGTFTYDLEREVREILISGRSDRKTLVAAHLTYLHIATYPRTIDLSWKERLAVVTAPAGSIRDRTFHWEDSDLPGDALALHPWKIARIQSVLSTVVDQTGFVERGGKLLVFSDHGERAGLRPQTFTDQKYHHVVLASIGFPARPAEQPISLIDILPLTGLVERPPADPVVEFAIAPVEQWERLGDTSRIHWSGFVDLDPDLLQGLFRHLRVYRPWLRPGVAANGQSTRVFETAAPSRLAAGL